jgi:hypothetical protein
METKVFVYSLRSNSSSFINIDNLPLLMFASVVTPDTNSLTFFVFASFNIKDLVVIVEVDESVSRVFEELPPSRVCAPDLHVVGFTRALDIPRLIVVSCFDSQGLLMEVPDL